MTALTDHDTLLRIVLYSLLALCSPRSHLDMVVVRSLRLSSHPLFIRMKDFPVIGPVVLVAFRQLLEYSECCTYHILCQLEITILKR
jgi:hypothetical protein